MSAIDGRGNELPSLCTAISSPRDRDQRFVTRSELERARKLPSVIRFPAGRARCRVMPDRKYSTSNCLSHW